LLVRVEVDEAQLMARLEHLLVLVRVRLLLLYTPRARL
jgi:hypothetical protein